MPTHDGVEIGDVIAVWCVLTADPHVGEDRHVTCFRHTEHTLHHLGAQVVVKLLDERSRPADELEAASALLDGGFEHRGRSWVVLDDRHEWNEVRAVSA